ncbi:MAG: right-handed parallel beta-helix repeat-containing protein [Pirellulaceae bacterium]
MRRSDLKLVSLVAATALVVSMLSVDLRAEDFYVNNIVGADTNNGKKSTDPSNNSGPFRTIARALRGAQRGDRVFVEKTTQPYYESLGVQGVRNSGTDYMPFSIISNGAILDGSQPVDPGAWEHYGGNVFRFMPRLKSHQQLYLDGKPAERVPARKHGFVPGLEAGQWALTGGWIYFCVADGRIPGNYDLRYCAEQTGITLYEVDNVVIEGLVIQGFQLDGVNAHDAVTQTIVRQCNLRGNGRSGLSVGGAARLAVVESIVGANGAAQVRSEGYSQVFIENCRLIESRQTGPAMVNDGGRIAVDGKWQ